MTARPTPTKTAGLALRAETAADMMTPNPVSIGQDATVPEAVALLADRGITGAPVIDAAGRPVGVVTRSDLLARRREGAGFAPPPAVDTGRRCGGGCRRLAEGFHAGAADRCPVSDVMTPGVFAVGPAAPAAHVVEHLLALRVHRVFVVDPDGTVVGVVTPYDVLRHLRS